MHIDHLIQIAARKLINTGQVSKSVYWQGIENKNPLYQAIKVYLGPAIMPKGINELQELTLANQPWAESHFKERIYGLPLNPGNTYKDWPYYVLDKEMRTENGQFTHTYMERYWPKIAGIYQDEAMLHIPSGKDNRRQEQMEDCNMGIRYEYGDLVDVLRLLRKDPETRQAYLPIWFPEDTGAVHGGRVPCTLGYLFQIVNTKLHMTYYIRSCDLLRHFRDDIYLSIRLCQHVLLSLQLLDSKFNNVELGLFDMHIGSLHIFNAEVNKVKKEYNL